MPTLTLVDHLHVTGFLLMALALMHAVFPRYFNWKEELARLSLINRQMMQMHSFFLALVLLGMGLLCVMSGQELVGTSLGKRICLGLGVFWITRLLVQFVGYSSKNWRGKTFETTMHVVLALFWSYLSGVFLVAAMS